jgi:hypothetical protein
MKTLLLVAAAAMVATMLSGCATHETTTTTTAANPARQTYSNSELRETGQPNTAGAIEAVDSSVQVR